MSALTEHDRAALREAIELIKDVVERHPNETTGQVLTAVNVAVHGIDNVQRYLELCTKESQHV